jgi:hypothetical protein
VNDSIALRKAWEEHPRYRYRGCAPDVDDPRRAAGNLDLSLDAWSGEDRDGGESQREREARQAAAIDVCFGCAVMVQCDAYANSVTADGKLAEPDGVWGGRTALERHKALIKARVAAPAAPDRRFERPQKRAVIHALAGCWDPFEVAAVASRLLLSWGELRGMDVRTANWQRSNLTTLLGLPRTASRAQLLAAAGERGLLEGVAVVADDGSVPAVPPPTRMPTPPEPAAAPAPVSALPVLPEPGPYEPVRVPRPRRDRFADIEGQLALWEAELADIHSLFPDTNTNERLEAAA